MSKKRSKLSKEQRKELERLLNGPRRKGDRVTTKEEMRAAEARGQELYRKSRACRPTMPGYYR